MVLGIIMKKKQDGTAEIKDYSDNEFISLFYNEDKNEDKTKSKLISGGMLKLFPFNTREYLGFRVGKEKENVQKLLNAVKGQKFVKTEYGKDSASNELKVNMNLNDFANMYGYDNFERLQKEHKLFGNENLTTTLSKPIFFIGKYNYTYGENLQNVNNEHVWLTVPGYFVSCLTGEALDIREVRNGIITNYEKSINSNGKITEGGSMKKRRKKKTIKKKLLKTRMNKNKRKSRKY